MTFGSLFTGIGGMDLGLERAGWECRWQSEIEPFCLKVLEKHWPEVKRHGDIKGLTGAELEPVDLICAGFPCQDLSQAGKRVGLEGSRSGLWFEAARIIGVLRPRWVLLENVPGLLTMPRAMARVSGDLARLGYVGLNLCLRASDFGASHLRKRVFIVAYRNGAGHGEIARRTTPPLREQGSNGDRLTPSQGDDLAHRPPGGRGELRQPSGSGGQPDGGNEGLGHLEDARHAGAGRPAESPGEYRSGPPDHDSGAGRALADPGDGQLQEPGRGQEERTGLGPAGADVPDASQPGLPHTEQAQLPGAQPDHQGRAAPELRGAQVADLGAMLTEQSARDRARYYEAQRGRACDGLPTFAPGPNNPRWPAILRVRPDLAPSLAYTGYGDKRRLQSNGGDGSGNTEAARRDQSASEAPTPDGSGETAIESPLRGVADGLPDWAHRAMSDRTKRLKALGNAVVPACAEWVARKILEAYKQ